MTPLQIELKNFRTIGHAVIDLSGITLAAIVGPNGTGKSTFFTWGPVFSLFGLMPDGLSLADMVKTGTQDMSAIFMFEHNNEVYRTIRTYSLKGRGKSTLDLQKQVNNSWQSLSGTDIRETQKKINDLLNLDGKTFIASSMILQGRANEFTSKTAGERKETFIDILGLTIYEDLRKAAAEKEKAISLKLEKTKDKLAELKEKLKEKPGLEAQQDEINKQLALYSCDIRDLETTLSDTQETIKSLELKQSRLNEVNKQWIALNEEITANDNEIKELEKKITQARIILNNEAEILAKCAELDTVKTEITTLEAKEPQVSKLNSEIRQLNLELTKTSQAEQQFLKKIQGFKAELANRASLEQATNQLKQLELELIAMDKLAEQHEELSQKDRDKSEEYRTAVNDFNNKKQSLETELTSLQKRTQMLANAHCIDIENADCVFLKDAKEAQTKIPGVEAELAALDETVITSLLEEVKELKRQTMALHYDIIDHKKLKASIAELKPKADQYAQLSGKEELLQAVEKQLQENHDRQSQLKKQIDVKTNENTAITKELAPLPSLKEKLKELELAAEDKDKLPEARITIHTCQETSRKLIEESLSKEEQKDKLNDEAVLLEQDLTALPDARQQAEKLQSDIKILQSQQNNLHGQIGRIQAQLDVLLKDEEELKALKADMEPLAKELVRWQTLVKAYSKKGIPALIIENAIPQLERISNDILSQMTNGQNGLRFETQVDTKDKKGVKEVLEILVSDWECPEGRPYESFSGGEQLRIDLAIRIGLAELLANRAGSKVEFIVGDELFGSQDTEHRKLVIDAIKAISSRFKKVFIITHIEDAQGMFDQIIEFKRTEQGTQVMVA